MLIHRDAFIHGCFYFHKDMLLHTDVYTYRSFYAEMILRATTPYAQVLYTGTLLYRSFYTQTRRYFYTQMPLHR